ncbi:AT-rich interactive domain-containing protein 3A, partial [Nibea albiflora]
MPSASCCRQLPVALGPLETTSTFTSSSCSSSSLLPPPSPPRGRRFRRVLYPASQSRRPPMREAPDQARRWLLIFSALVFLQIYTEETHTCTG